jgi:hypothetical protein
MPYRPSTDPDVFAVQSPLEISGCKAWFRAESETGLNDGDALGTWTDQSGAGNNAVQSTADNKPLYKAGVLNGKAVVRFDGSNDKLKSASAVISATAARSLFAVYRIFDLSGSNPRTIAGEGDTASASKFFFLQDRGDVAGAGPYFAGYNDDLASGYPVNFPVWKIASVSWAGSSGAVKLYRDTVLVNQGNKTLNVSSDGFRVGYNPSGGGGEYMYGDIAEVIYYDSQLSAADHLSVVRYLRKQYGFSYWRLW